MSAAIASIVTGEISGNSLILLGVLIVMVPALAYGLYTRQGSGINLHPGPDSQDTVVGDATKSENEDLEGNESAGVDRTESAEMSQRGVQ